MQRAAQAPQLSLSQNMLWAWELGSTWLSAQYLGFGFNFLIVPTKRFFAAVNIPPLSLLTAFSWVQRCHLFKDNAVLPTKGMRDTGPKYIAKPNLMHKVLHPTSPNYLFCP